MVIVGARPGGRHLSAVVNNPSAEGFYTGMEIMFPRKR